MRSLNRDSDAHVAPSTFCLFSPPTTTNCTTLTRGSLQRSVPPVLPFRAIRTHKAMMGPVVINTIKSNNVQSAGDAQRANSRREDEKTEQVDFTSVHRELASERCHLGVDLDLVGAAGIEILQVCGHTTRGHGLKRACALALNRRDRGLRGNFNLQRPVDQRLGETVPTPPRDCAVLGAGGRWNFWYDDPRRRNTRGIHLSLEGRVLRRQTLDAEIIRNPLPGQDRLAVAHVPLAPSHVLNQVNVAFFLRGQVARDVANLVRVQRLLSKLKTADRLVDQAVTIGTNVTRERNAGATHVLADESDGFDRGLFFPFLKT